MTRSLFVLLAACGGAAPQPPLTPTLPEPGAGSAKPVETPAPPVAPPAGKGLPAPVVQALANTKLYVATIDGLLLFPDEQLEAQNIVSRWARGEGLAVEDPARTMVVIARAAAGQDVRTGKACGAPLYAFEAHARWRAELAATGKIEARVSCDPDCMLQVSLSIGTEGEGGTEFFAAPFDPAKPWRDELAARLATISDNGGHDRYGHLNNPVKIAGIARPPNGRDLIAGSPQNLLTVAASQCFTYDRATTIQVEYGERGAVTRCEPVPGHWAVSAACVCKTLDKRTGAPHAREQLDAYPAPPPPAPTVGGKAVRAFAHKVMVPDAGRGLYKPLVTDPAIEDWDPPEPERLAPCFRDVTGPLDGRISIDFDAEGKPTKVTVTGPLTSAQQSCVRDRFSKIRAPCPSTPASTATAELKVTL